MGNEKVHENRILSSLLKHYRTFDIANLQSRFQRDLIAEVVEQPESIDSYALMRASLNVFIHEAFADPLNSLAFGRDAFLAEVQRHARQVWPFYLEETQARLRSARVRPLSELQFVDWRQGGKPCLGAWHAMDFPGFRFGVLMQISNSQASPGSFEGLCFLHSDQNPKFQLPADAMGDPRRLKSRDREAVVEEILNALGIRPASALAAIQSQSPR